MLEGEEVKEERAGGGADNHNTEMTNSEDIPLIKPKNDENTATSQEGVFSRAPPAEPTLSNSISLITADTNSKATPVPQGKKLLIQLVDEEEHENPSTDDSASVNSDKGIWATTKHSKDTVPSNKPNDDILVEDLETTALGSDTDKELFELAGKVPEQILQDYDVAAEKYERALSEQGEDKLTREDRVWGLAAKLGSTLDEDQVELDEKTKSRLKARVASTVDSSSLCF